MSHWHAEREEGWPASTRVAAPVKKGWRVFDARRIPMFRADTKYTTFTVEGREYMITDSLQALERRLHAHGFMRVHRGTLVNLTMVRAVQRRGRQTSLELTSDACVAVSRRYTPALCQALGIGPSSKTAIPCKPVPRVGFGAPMSGPYAHNFQPGCERAP